MYQHTADMNNPEEHMLWALRGVEYKDQPITIAEPIMRAVSAHLYRCGFRHHPELQEIHYQPPIHGQDHYMNQSGRWVPITQALVDKDESEHEAKLAMVEQLRKEGYID